MSDAPTFSPRRHLPLGWAATAITAALGESLLSALHGTPFALRVWALRTLLLLLPLALVALVMVLLYPLRTRLGATGSHVSVGSVALGSLLMVCGGGALWVTEFESSVALRSARGLGLLGLFGGAALVIAISGGWLAARSRLLRRVGALPLGAGMATSLAILTFVLGRNSGLVPFWPLRFVNTFLEAALALAAAALLRRVNVLGARTVWAGAAVMLAAVAIALTAPASSAHLAYARILKEGGSERRVLLRLRRLLDFDNNGFSAWLDGGDCDDRDPRARPLGEIDCDHMLHLGEPASPPPPLDDVPQVSRVLLVTIDTWRCELRGQTLCPRMSALAPTASYFGTQRPFMAMTPRSLGAIFGAPFNQDLETALARPSYTLARARAAGYHTKAFYTLFLLSAPSLGGAFDERDETLADFGPGERVNSGALTRLVTAELVAHKDDPSRRLLWAHYLDPHATYVPSAEGEPVPFFLFDRRGAYAAEVERVEAHVADLIDSARRLGYDRDAAIIVTADHGESFSHGRLYHSLSSYDGEMKVPLFVWVFDKQGKQVKVPLSPRADERDLATLLARLVGAAPPPGQSGVSVTDPMDGDVQFLLVDDGWKIVYHLQGHYEELYNLTLDPLEENDLAASAPQQLERMRRRLGAELWPLYPEHPAPH